MLQLSAKQLFTGVDKKLVLPPCHHSDTGDTFCKAGQAKHHGTRAASGQEALLRCRSAAQARGYSQDRPAPGGQSLIGALTFLFLLWHDPVDLVGLRDVQLGPVRHLLEVRALVQGAAQSCLPSGRLRFVAFFELAFKNSPGLKQSKKTNPPHELCKSPQPPGQRSWGCREHFALPTFLPPAPSQPPHAYSTFCS